MEGSQPPPRQLGNLGECCKLPSGVQGSRPLLVLQSAVSFVTDDRKSQAKTAYCM